MTDATTLYADCEPHITLVFNKNDMIVSNMLCVCLCPRPTLKVEIKDIVVHKHLKCPSNIMKEEIECGKYHASERFKLYSIICSNTVDGQVRFLCNSLSNTTDIIESHFYDFLNIPVQNMSYSTVLYSTDTATR